MIWVDDSSSGGRSCSAKPFKREASGGGVQTQDEGGFDDDVDCKNYDEDKDEDEDKV